MQGISKNGMVTIIVVSFSKMLHGILHLTMCSQTILEKSKQVFTDKKYFEILGNARKKFKRMCYTIQSQINIPTCKRVIEINILLDNGYQITKGKKSNTFNLVFFQIFIIVSYGTEFANHLCHWTPRVKHNDDFELKVLGGCS